MSWVVAGAGASLGAIAVAFQYPFAGNAALGTFAVFMGAAAVSTLAGALGRAARLPAMRLPWSGISTPTLALAGSLVFVIGTLVFWRADFRHAGFRETGWPLVLYNFWRLCLIGYVIVILRGAGWAIRLWLERRTRTALGESATERFLIDLAAGAALFIVGMYAAGVAGLLYRPLALVIAAPACAAGLVATIGESRNRRRNDDRGPLDAGLVAFVALSALMLVVVSGLANIAVEYDSTHYLPYYEEVVANHGIRLNDYWYHAWITKGAGLQFLAVLLGDVFSASAAAFALLVLAAASVAAFLRRAFPEWRAVPTAGVAVFLTPFIYALAYQQKGHFVVMGLVAASAWVAAWLCRPGSATLKPGLALLALLAAAAVIVSTPMAAVLCLALGLLAIALVAASPTGRRLRMLPAAIGPAAIAGITAAIVLATTYLQTGMAEATPFKLFFDHADQVRLAGHVSPYLWLFLAEGSSSDTGAVLWQGMHLDLQRIWTLLHFGALSWPGLVMQVILVAGAIGAAAVPAVRQRIGWPLISLAAFLAGAGSITVVVSQPGSLDRLYVFALPLSLLALFTCAGAILLIVGRYARVVASVLAALASVAVVVDSGAFAFAVYDHGAGFRGTSCESARAEFGGSTALGCQAAFLAGAVSLENALGVTEACRRMEDTLAPEVTDGKAVRVWTLNFIQPVGCYLMPSARLLLEVSAGFGPQWHRFVLGDRDEALDALHGLGIRYFYIDLAPFDADEHRSASLFGCMAYSALFDPGAVARDFRMVWREGDAFLLTLADQSPVSAALPPDFAALWAKKRDEIQPAGQLKEVCARVAGYYQAQGERWPVHADPDLPRLKGWQ